MRSLAVFFMVLFLLGSCSPASRKTREYNTGKTRVKVENRNISRMTIYVLKRSEKVMLGSVAGLETRVFAIPDYLVGGATPISLLADPVGSNKTPVSEQFIVRRGDVIEMVIRAF